MVDGLALFTAGLAVTIGQAAVFGMIALWTASRRSRLVRILGGIVIVSLAWASAVPLINRATGYATRYDLFSNVVAISALLLGWLSGRNRRVQAACLAETARPRVVLDRPVHLTGSWVAGLSMLYGAAVGLCVMLVILRVVYEASGMWGAVAAVILFPGTIVGAPLLVGLVTKDWLPAILGYGGMLATFLGFTFGNLVAAESEERNDVVIAKP